MIDTRALPKLLIVDDTPQNIALLSETLAEFDVDILVATDGAKALEIAGKTRPSLVLLDVMMPGMDGFEVCSRLKQQPETQNIPVIFVTARTDDVARGFEVGGYDYITKPINPAEVRARVRHQLERLQMLGELVTLNQHLEEKVRARTSELTLSNYHLREEINERRYLQDRLNYLATHDFVTRTYSRNALETHVTQLLAKVQMTEGLTPVFLMMDIDQFRSINETFGCIAGDEVLKQFADLISGLLDRGDFFARLGGDKFAIVSDNIAAGSPMRLATAIHAQLQQHSFSWNDRQFQLSVSLAVVEVDREVISFEQLMLMADETAYLCKRQGKGGMLQYTEVAARQRDHRATYDWAVVLLKALRENHFQVYFQRLRPLKPELDQGFRFETLIRLWDKDQQKLIYPGSFIAPAERFMMISDLDRWMIREVITFLGSQPDKLHLIQHVALNLSAITLREPGLSDYVQDLLKMHNVPASKLCFEITETEAIVNIERARTLMEELHAKGCSFALDDFGSGFASFSYLKELPFDYIKIDGIFVREMDVDEAQHAMVKSMVEMAHRLGKPVVAEFVENTRILERLGALEVDWAQGYAVHVPELLTWTALTGQVDTPSPAESALP
ncbi:two-component system response regulator [Leeia oryzae]|uniref:two-component system response regulator n=1 Tax=Leeia oryzae TaxID=356662 RepID=UPI0003648CE1|nr:EAL domain-containing protein [Leeia oryzae]